MLKEKLNDKKFIKNESMVHNCSLPLANVGST